MFCRDPGDGRTSDPVRRCSNALLANSCSVEVLMTSEIKSSETWTEELLRSVFLDTLRHFKINNHSFFRLLRYNFLCFSYIRRPCWSVVVSFLVFRSDCFGSVHTKWVWSHARTRSRRLFSACSPTFLQLVPASACLGQHFWYHILHLRGPLYATLFFLFSTKRWLENGMA